MKWIILIAAFAVVSLPLAAQNIERVLQQIEQNNTTLKALADQAEADKLGNRTGISLSDPEVEFARLWGSPATVGNRTDIVVTQGFDIATVSGMRLRQARRQNGLIDLQFASERTNILLEAKQYCIELIYNNRLAAVLQTRLDYARTTADGYAARLANGDANVLEYNKAQLSLRTAQGEFARNEVERTTLLAELVRLNGGVEMSFDYTCFPPMVLPVDFDAWYAEAEQRSSVLAYGRREVEVNRKEISLANVEWMPEFSVGYMREKTLGQHYQGVKVGMSIPLFGNRNRVRHARAAHAAAEARALDTQVGFYTQLHDLYARAVVLGMIAADYRSAMNELSSADLLKKALDASEISLLEYIVEMDLYYDTVNLTLEAERDFQQTCAALTAVEL